MRFERGGSGLEPPAELLVHLGPAQQVEVPDSVPDPPALVGKRQRPLRPLVTTERAVDRNEAVPGEPGARLRRESPCDREALHAGGQREVLARIGAFLEAIAPFPVLVED